jgi:apolipoprotein N-acyltransferase
MNNLLIKLVNINFIQKCFINFLLGSLSVLALDPINFFYILFITLPLFLVNSTSYNNKKQIQYKKKLLHIFVIGSSFGFGYFFFGLYWINISFLHQIETYYFLIIPSLFLIPIVLSVFYGLMTLLLFLFCPKNISRVFVFSIIWTLMEFVRSLITVFPWAQIGHSLIPVNKIIQIISIFGELSLTTIAIILFTFPVIFLFEKDNYLKKTSLIIFILIFVSIFTFSSLRQYNNTITTTNIEVNILQPNISQKNKWDPSFFDKNINKLIDETIKMVKSESKIPFKQRYFIWPETAIPIFVDENLSVTRKITKYFNEDDYLMIGSIRKEKNIGENYKFFNSLFIINSKNEIIGKYDKNQLVPFGEYIPLNNLLRKLKFINFNAIGGNFSKGYDALSVRNHSLLIPEVLICYEAIFSKKLYKNLQKTDWLLNITNDAWFGKSSGPYQHFNMARLRAVERGKPLVRVANTGISGIINPYGKIISKSLLNTEFYTKEILPKKTVKTFYTRYNYYPLFFILILSFLLIYYVNKKNYHNQL